MRRFEISTTELFRAVIAGHAGPEIGDVDEVIVSCPNAHACMLELSAAGVPNVKLSWRDDDNQVRDFMGRDYRWASDLPETPDDKYLVCGIDGLGKRLRWRLPELTLIAGPYASGKSLLAQVLAQDFVNRNDQWASLTCWEDQADEVRDGLIRYRDSTAVPHFRKNDFLSRFRMTIVHDDLDREISAHFSRIEYEAKRFGIKFFVLDPWNEFDHRKSPKQTEGDYVIRVLTDAAKLVNRLGIDLILTTHVAAEFVAHGSELKPFRIANAFGSSQFGNKVHRGLCCARTRLWDSSRSHMVIRQDKVKLEDKIAHRGENGPTMVKRRMGYPDTMAFLFDPDVNTLHHDEDASEEARKKWK